MANKKLNILHHPKKLLLIVVLASVVAVLGQSPKAQAAACTTPATNMGTVTSTTNVTTAGTYRIWSRIMSGTASSDNSYDLEITGAEGTNCAKVGNLSTMPTGSWQWIDYESATATNKVDIALSAGSHTIKMIGTEDGVKLDRIIMTTDTACVPTGTGDNCVSTADTTSPVSSITAPVANAKVRGTVTINATASDDSGIISKVEYYVDNSLVGTDTASPYSFNWNSVAATNGTHSLTVKAYDQSNNVGTSAAVSVTVDNSPPTVSITAPTGGSTLVGTVSINATATDNVGVTSVDFYRGTTLLASDTTSPYSYSWPTTSVTDGSYALTAKANDAAGNITTSATVNVTVKNTVTPPPDTVSPATSVTAPTGGSTVTGTVNVTASATDNVGVTKVELYVDGTFVAADVASPYAFSLNTTSYSNGTHSLVTRAYDLANNVGISTAVSVTVNNGSSNPGDVTGDGHVTIIDLSVLLTNYGKPTATRAQGDLDGNGTVNILDLSRLLTNYGS